MLRLPESEAPPCACADAREHWRRFVRPPHPMVLPSEACARVGCLGPATHGVPVRKAGLEEGGPCIVLLCEACRTLPEDQPLALKAAAGLAPAEPRATCRPDLPEPGLAP